MLKGLLKSGWNNLKKMESATLKNLQKQDYRDNTNYQIVKILITSHLEIKRLEKIFKNIF